ncbi:hypothetical protein OKW33_007727 [Paraburkholderia atlantica]
MRFGRCLSFLESRSPGIPADEGACEANHRSRGQPAARFGRSAKGRVCFKRIEPGVVPATKPGDGSEPLQYVVSRGCERVCSNAARDVGAYSLIVGKGQVSPRNGPDRRGFEGVRDVPMRPSQHIPAPTFPRWPLCLHPRNLFEFVGPAFAGGLACDRSAEDLGFVARPAMCSLANTSVSNASML